MLSPTGRSRMWDAAADGYARGEGIAAVVLKTLSQALKDGDHIECLIRETGVNQDGRTSGLTVPSHVAQTELIRSTYARAGLDLGKAEDRPQFFHAHGTGTKAGDPQEAEAIYNAFFSGEDAAAEKMYVGSIKTIIGHTEGTAGLASLIGTSLAIRNGTIPPNLHFDTLNSDIVPFYSHLEIPRASIAWPIPAAARVRRASINSFGFGGTNAHAILEEYTLERQSSERSVADTLLPTPLVFSANSAVSLKTMLSEHLAFLAANSEVSLRDQAWTLQHRRSVLPYRAIVAGRSRNDVSDRIRDKIKGSAEELNVRYGNVDSPRILGIFTGQGAQWPRMGAELLRASPMVARCLADLDDSLAGLPASGRPVWTLKDQLLAAVDTSRVAEAALSQPLCTAVQIVLVELLRSAGVRMAAVVGHSSGEIGAAYAAGLVSARDAIRIAYYRGLHARLAASPNGTDEKGAMAAVSASADQAEAFCQREEFAGRVSVAAYNSAFSLTLSGDAGAIDEAVDVFK